jgi:hypothetical protein
MAFLDMGPNDIDMQKGLLDELLHALKHEWSAY